MKNKLAVIVTVLAIIVNFAGCGADNGLIKINISEEYASLYTEEDLNESIEKGNIEDAYFNSDKSLTFEVTAEQHEIMINKCREEAVEVFNEFAAEEGDSILDIEFNDTFTRVDITAADDITDTERENLNDAIFLIARFHEMIAQSGAEYVDIAYNSSTDGELIHLSVLEFELQ